MRATQSPEPIDQSPEPIQVIELAIDAIHGRGFTLDVPEPSPFYTFTYYNCPIVLEDVRGRREWPAGVSIIKAPEDPRYVSAESTDLLNTWFHFEGPGVLPCLTKYGVPTNTVLDLGDLPFLRPILEEARRERTQQPLYWQDAVSDLLRRLFRELGTLISDLDNSLTPAQRKSERMLRDIRMHVHSDLARHWTVSEMAAFGGLHPTWFATIYTKQFGVSPMNDLLNARLKHAEALLRHLPMTVTHISAACGFASVEHFTRLFHKRMGCTPGQIRKQGKREGRK
jgi:AraC family transcriptional regulator of arabinose operon